MFYKTGHIVDVYIIDTCPVWFDISRIHMDKRSLRMDNNYCGQFERDIMWAYSFPVLTSFSSWFNYQWEPDKP